VKEILDGRSWPRRFCRGFASHIRQLMLWVPEVMSVSVQKLIGYHIGKTLTLGWMDPFDRKVLQLFFDRFSPDIIGAYRNAQA